MGNNVVINVYCLVEIFVYVNEFCFGFDDCVLLLYLFRNHHKR